MAVDVSKLSVAEVRRRYLAADAAVSGQVMARLMRDPRRGVRQVYDALRRRHDRERQEQLRLDGLLNFERVLWATGVTRIAGVDESGVGPLAGPVIAAAVVFPPGARIAGVDDSKRLDPEQREALEVEIRAVAEIGVGVAEVHEIDALNVYHATLLALRRAVEALPSAPEHVLVDARRIPGVDVPQNPFDRGDGLNFSIAAASIIAKTHRDRLMSALDAAHPAYGFARHKGYSTPEHQDAIRAHGPSPAHRRSYAYLRELCGGYSDAFYALSAQLAAARTPTDLDAVDRALASGREELEEVQHRKLRAALDRRWKAAGRRGAFG